MVPQQDDFASPVAKINPRHQLLRRLQNRVSWQSIAALKAGKNVACTVPMPCLLSRVDVLFSTQGGYQP